MATAWFTSLCWSRKDRQQAHIQANRRVRWPHPALYAGLSNCRKVENLIKKTTFAPFSAARPCMIPTELIVLSDCVCQYTLSLRRPCIVLYWTPDESRFWYQYPINAICQILYDGTVQCRFRFTTERKYGEWLYRLFVRYTLFGKRTQTWEGKDAGPMRAGNRPTVWNDRPPPGSRVLRSRQLDLIYWDNIPVLTLV